MRKGNERGDESRPHCINCRRAMLKNGLSAEKRPRWRCPVCRAGFTAHTSRALSKPRASRAAADDRAPCCLGCRAPMRHRSASGRNHALWYCPDCHAACQQEYRTLPRTDVEQRPACGECGRPKAPSGSDARRFKCSHCRRQRRALRRCPEVAAELLRQIDAALPASVPPDARDDVRQSAFLAVLAGKLPPVNITSQALRPFARAARGMSQDRFRFISLASPLPNGGTFGELLEG